MKKMKYCGNYKQRVLGPGLHVDVNPGDSIEVSNETYQEFKDHDDWEFVEEKESKKIKKNGGDE